MLEVPSYKKDQQKLKSLLQQFIGADPDDTVSMGSQKSTNTDYSYSKPHYSNKVF